MTTLAHEIANRLASFGSLTTPAGSGGLGFLILERWPVPDGPGATPEAFDPARGNRLKRCIVVLDGGERPHPSRQSFDFRKWDSSPQTQIFAEAHLNGKEAAHAAYLLIESMLINWQAVVAGQRIGFVTENRLDLEDSEAFPGNVRIVATWRATGVRTLVPAA
jgi:hypothetical protein